MSKTWTYSEWESLFSVVSGSYFDGTAYIPCEFRLIGEWGSPSVEGVATGYPSFLGRTSAMYQAFHAGSNTPISAYFNSSTLTDAKFILNFDFTVRSCDYLSLGFCGYNYPDSEFSYYHGVRIVAYEEAGTQQWEYSYGNVRTFIAPQPDNNYSEPPTPCVFGWAWQPVRGLGAIDDITLDSPQNLHFKSLKIASVGSNSPDGSFFGVFLPITNDDAQIVMGGSDIPEMNGGDNVTQSGGGGTFEAPSDTRGGDYGVNIINEFNNATYGRTAELQKIISTNYGLYIIPESNLNDIVTVLYSSGYFQRFVNSMYNPLSAILNCALLPEKFVAAESTNDYDLTAGGYNISQNIYPSPVQFKRAVSLHAETIGYFDFSAYFDAFPDFSPYTTIKLHLPYIGVIDIDTEKVMYGSVSVIYSVDVMSGNCCAWVWCNDKNGNHTFCYTATGNCAYTLPLFASQSDGSAIGKFLGGVTSLAMGNPIAAGVSLTNAAISANTRQTNIVGNFGGNLGMIGDTICWLEIIRPQWVETPNYKPLHGIPSYIGESISDLEITGFVRCEKIELDAVPCTDEEKTQIEQIMKNGIYILSES